MQIAKTGVSGYFPMAPESVVMAGIEGAASSSLRKVQLQLSNGEAHTTIVPHGDMWELVDLVSNCRTYRELLRSYALADINSFNGKFAPYGPTQSKSIDVQVGESKLILMPSASGWTLDGEAIQDGHQIEVDGARHRLYQIGRESWFAVRVLSQSPNY